MVGRIYLIGEDSNLTSMDESPYDSEILLQELLARYPDLLAGEQINSDIPRRWLLVMREMSVPGEMEGSGRWSLDHLFLDQDAIPTLVEVKRSSDTRIRREVVGQMLDYAANAVSYWPTEEIRSKFEGRCQRDGKDPERVVNDAFGDEVDFEEFWQRVKTNIQAGRIRMVFLADEIPTELLRVVEFLNQQMDPAEVLAIEVKQFVAKGMKTLVPRVLGQTARKIVDVKRIPIPEVQFVNSFKINRSESELKSVQQLIKLAKDLRLEVSFFRGKRRSAFVPTLKQNGRSYSLISVEDNGSIVLLMRRLKETPPFDSALARETLFQKIQSLKNLKLYEVGMEGFPTFPISSLDDAQQLRTFENALRWMVDEIRSISRGEE